jgi:hypothetical protein
LIEVKLFLCRLGCEAGLAASLLPDAITTSVIA